MKKALEEQLLVIKRNAEEIIPEDELVRKLERSLKEKKPLRVKQGFDPTAPDIHLGHTIGLRKLRQFQELGHTAILIVGDYTGMVGDPSGRSETRPQLSHDEVMKNSETYLKQFFKIVDKSKTEVHYNGEWFSKMNFTEIMKLASLTTVARMLERDDFSERMKNRLPIGIHELFYPIMQGYDSVAIQADIEIGATEQKFNLLVARQIQEAFKMDPQVVLTLPVLEGTDGAQRMSKSTGNYIGIDETPKEIFGKTMSIPDSLIMRYFELASDLSMKEIEAIRKNLANPAKNPMEEKKRLAWELVRIYHDREAADRARDDFIKQFTKRELPEEMPTLSIAAESGELGIKDLLRETGMASSGSEAWRLVDQGAVEIDGRRVVERNHKQSLKNSFVLKVGRKYVRVVPIR
ncbi:MAG: tyrosine--tRNA ligase [Candidatus Eisenbacteria bacterium]|nr:tyrosine--tRNA ligase [Candidatus Eisenbacteria bacterium]